MGASDSCAQYTRQPRNYMSMKLCVREAQSGCHSDCGNALVLRTRRNRRVQAERRHASNNWRSTTKLAATIAAASRRGVSACNAACTRPASSRIGSPTTRVSGTATTSADGKKEFVLVDAESRHAATGIRSREAGGALVGRRRKKATSRSSFLSIASSLSRWQQAVRFVVEGLQWECNLDSYECKKLGDAPDDEDDDDEADEGAISAAGGAGSAAAAARATRWRRAFARRQVERVRSRPQCLSASGQSKTKQPSENADKRVATSSSSATDGTEDARYGMLQWSPDSKTLVAFRIEPGDRKEVYLVESSPRGGGRAKLHTRPYALPGDKFTSYELNLFDVADTQADQAGGRQDRLGLPAHALAQRRPALHLSRKSTAATSGSASSTSTRTPATRANIIDEQTETFIWTAHTENVDLRARQLAAKTRRDHLRLRARRLAAPVPGRRQGRRHQEPDHPGRVRRPRHRPHRRREAADLVPRQRQERRPGSVLHPLLPRQLRRHGPGRAHRGRRQPLASSSRPTAST